MFKKISFLVVLVIEIFTVFTSTSLPLMSQGLSDAQKKVLQSGVYYFNTEVDQCPGISNDTTSQSGRLYLIGDSVAAGASIALDSAFKAKGFSEVAINATPSRSLVNSKPELNGLGVLAADKAQYANASTVIIELGTNSSGLDGANIQKAVDTVKSAAPAAKIFWVNVGADNSKRNGAPLNTESLNQTIKSGSGYAVIDWSSQVTAHPDYIDSNPSTGLGVHLSETGKPAYANFISNSLSGQSSGQAADSTAACQCVGSSLLTGGDNPSKIWNYLVGKALKPVAAAAVMGNLQKESGFNPRRVQNTQTPSGDRDNMVIDGRTGFGLAQWTNRGRQQNLHNFAVSRKTIDGDLSTQLDFLYQEAGGVWQKLNSFGDMEVGPATLYFHNTYENSADLEGGLRQRVQFATDILAKFGGAGGAGGGISQSDGNCSGGGSAQSIVDTAIKLAWPDKSHGMQPKPEYLEAAQKILPGVSTEKLTNCSFYVATVMISSGVDTSYPTGCSRGQADYAKAHPDKYDVVDNVTDITQLKPGDILVVGGCGVDGHTFIFIGDHSGNNKADASQGSRMANLGHQNDLKDSRGTYTRIRIKG